MPRLAVLASGSHERSPDKFFPLCSAPKALLAEQAAATATEQGTQLQPQTHRARVLKSRLNKRLCLEHREGSDLPTLTLSQNFTKAVFLPEFYQLKYQLGIPLKLINVYPPNEYSYSEVGPVDTPS